MDFNTQDLGARLIAGNSNPEFVGELIADFTRKLMSASVQVSPGGTITHATVDFMQILQHLGAFDSVKLRAAVSVAENSLRVDLPDSPEVEAAQAGVQFLLAKSASDGFSSARASKAYSAFRSAMQRAGGPTK